MLIYSKQHNKSAKNWKNQNDVGGRFQKKVKLNGKNLNNTKYLGILFSHICLPNFRCCFFLQPTDIFMRRHCQSTLLTQKYYTRSFYQMTVLAQKQLIFGKQIHLCSWLLCRNLLKNMAARILHLLKNNIWLLWLSYFLKYGLICMNLLIKKAR